MNRFTLFLLLGSLPTLVIVWPQLTPGQPPKGTDPADSVKAVKQIVTTFYENFSQGKAEANLKLFLNGDVTVVGIANGEGREKIQQKKVSELIKTVWKTGPTPHPVDSTEVELVDNALAVARVKMHTDFVKQRAVFTLTSEGGDWRIVSLVFETRLP
jgi:hypothetical protein